MSKNRISPEALRQAWEVEQQEKLVRGWEAAREFIWGRMEGAHNKDRVYDEWHRAVADLLSTTDLPLDPVLRRSIGEWYRNLAFPNAVKAAQKKEVKKAILSFEEELKRSLRAKGLSAWDADQHIAEALSKTGILRKPTVEAIRKYRQNRHR